MEKYYIGLDMGTSSVGWAVTDENYNLIRRKGKDMWGARLFPEAKTATDRRTTRVSRRRRDRQKARIGYLKEYFSDAINAVDPGFFARLEDSRFYIEDKREHQPYAIFTGEKYTDKDYHSDYPTIFHLRKELIYSDEPHDVRLVYLAILNIFKHRGHFLNNNLNNSGQQDFSALYETLKISFSNYFEKQLYDIADFDAVAAILTDKSNSRSARLEEIRETVGFDKKDLQNEMWKLICGMKGTIPAIFPGAEIDEAKKKFSLSFRDSNYDEKIIEAEEIFSSEAMDIINILKNIHDNMVLMEIMTSSDGKSYKYLSDARVAMYEKHGADLRIFKKLFKLYAPDDYNSMFRVMEDNNYSAYAGSVNSGNKIIRRGGKKREEDFFAALKKIIAKFPDDDEDVSYVMKELEKETFLPKQLTASNGVIPNQVHAAELRAILENAENYLDFLKEKDDSGLTLSKRIEQLFSFQIPYYVGPLINTDNNTAWVIRRQPGRVFPWNMDEKIDMKRTSEEFIQNLIRHCTYLSDEQVLPKNSLLYEKYMVLNELNNLRINGQKISVELKQDIYRDLFRKGKKVTGKKLEEYLKAKGIVSANAPIEITGIDGDFVNRLANYKKFLEIFDVDVLSYDMEQIAENIILWSTLYGDSRQFLKEKIDEEYKDKLTDKQKKRILGIKFKDWGRLSKEFLMLEGADKNTGEIKSIISRMWDENNNLMQLLSGENYTYRDEVEAKSGTLEKTLTELEYDDLKDLYISAPVRRMTWQTLKILKEIYQVMGEYPSKVFVEMARENGEKGKRTISRKKKFEELYKKCKEDERDWLKEISELDETKFRSKKLYLYYIQQGRCMYTGERIELKDLFNDNLYDIDHIYARHYVKDDNIDNNLVLVKKQVNSHKTDAYPIEADIRRKMGGFWKALHEKGFINAEKYKRLTRSEGFSDDELSGFISRQIVETRQGTKTITDIIKKSCPQTDVIYVKAGLTSDFRHKYDFIKCRNINDFHHAQDAYLNIVTGNVYNTKFTKSPANFIKESKANPNEIKYHMDKIFDFDVMRGDTVAWERDKSIAVIKGVMRKNTPIVTFMNYEAHGGLADQTLYSANKVRKADGKGYIPLKTSDERLLDTSKYGGFSGYTGTYFFVVEYDGKKGRIRSMEDMPLYLKDRLDSDAKLEEYCSKELGYDNPQIICNRIKRYSLFKINGFYAYISGRMNERLVTINAVQLVLSDEWNRYIKKINNAKERSYSLEYLKQKGEITANKNIALYEELMNKHTHSIYVNRPGAMGKKLESGIEGFSNLDLDEQIYILEEILKLSQRLNNGIDISMIGGGKSAGKATINKVVSDLNEFKIINQSVTGLYESQIDLLK